MFFFTTGNAISSRVLRLFIQALYMLRVLFHCMLYCSNSVRSRPFLFRMLLPRGHVILYGTQSRRHLAQFNFLAVIDAEIRGHGVM